MFPCLTYQTNGRRVLLPYSLHSVARFKVRMIPFIQSQKYI